MKNSEHPSGTTINTAEGLMRIVLDSNVYLSDLRMNGISFSNLFDFVRKTGATIVLPRIVREEVVARYIDRLNTHVREVAKAWKPYRYLMLDDQPRKFDKPTMKYQVRKLRVQLRKPAKNIETEYYPDTSGVDLNEVALRGIHRIPPANSEGEELRDVMIWFQVLAFAKATGATTIFISPDSGFWDEDSLKTQIQTDIIKSQANVKVYKSLDSFIKDNSPRQTKLTADSSFRLAPPSLYSDGILKAFTAELKRAGKSSVYEIFGNYGGDVAIDDVQLNASRFLQGVSYEINSNVNFISATYEFECKAVLKLEFQSEWSGIASPTGIGTTGNIFSFGLAGPGRPTLGGNILGIPPAEDVWASMQKKIAAIPESQKIQHVRAFGTASVSARIIYGAVSEKALEHFSLTTVQLSNKALRVSEVVGRTGPWLRVTEEPSVSTADTTTGETTDSDDSTSGGAE